MRDFFFFFFQTPLYIDDGDKPPHTEFVFIILIFQERYEKPPHTNK